MEENLLQDPPVEAPAKPSRPWLKVLPFLFLGAIFISALVFASYKLGRKQINPTVQPIPTSGVIVTPTPDLTANWKTYTNTKYSYEIKYPADFEADITNEDSSSFYRKDVVVSIEGKGPGLPPNGMTIYFRNYGNEEAQTRPTENTSIAGYPALRWTDNEPCQEDIWISNPSKKNTIRIFYTSCWEKEPYNKVDLEVFKQMVSTFKFLD